MNSRMCHNQGKAEVEPELGLQILVVHKNVLIEDGLLLNLTFSNLNYDSVWFMYFVNLLFLHIGREYLSSEP